MTEGFLNSLSNWFVAQRPHHRPFYVVLRIHGLGECRYALEIAVCFCGESPTKTWSFTSIDEADAARKLAKEYIEAFRRMALAVAQ
jgi:hypothetical protein